MSSIGEEARVSSLSAGLSPAHRHPRRYISLWTLAASAAAILVAGSWPVTSLETPRWEVWVFDLNGQPVEGVTVHMSYKNYSAESVGREQDLYTDAAGHVVFPARR